MRHPARFVLVGSGNPEEGELRPQLLDRFGLSVEVRTPDDLETRIEVVRRREAFERDPDGVHRRNGTKEDDTVRRRSLQARERACRSVARERRRWNAPRGCACDLGTDGLRGELTLDPCGARARERWMAQRSVTDGHCAAWRRSRCATGCAAIRSTRPAPPRASIARRRDVRRMSAAPRSPALSGCALAARLFAVDPAGARRHGCAAAPSDGRDRLCCCNCARCCVRAPAGPQIAARYRRRPAARRSRPCRDPAGRPAGAGARRAGRSAMAA